MQCGHLLQRGLCHGLAAGDLRLLPTSSSSVGVCAAPSVLCLFFFFLLAATYYAFFCSFLRMFSRRWRGLVGALQRCPLGPAGTSRAQPLASSQSLCSPTAKIWPPAPHNLTYQSGKNTNKQRVLTTVGIHNCQFSQGRWWCFALQLSNRKNCFYLGNAILCLPLSVFTWRHDLLFSECKCVI